MEPDMDPRVELHFHLLPGLDDGPADLAESIELARLAEADGTHTIVATPHVRADMVTDVRALGERVAEVQRALDAEGLALQVLAGGELGDDMVGRLSQRELESIAQGPPRARWLLLEAPFDAIDEGFHVAAAELRDRGFGVLVAHPERSSDAAFDGSAGLRRELREGALAQVNAQSITGDHGPAAREAAFALIGEGLVGVVSSDAHGPSRPPLLGEARAQLVANGVEVGVAAALTATGPHGLLARGIPRVLAVA